MASVNFNSQQVQLLKHFVDICKKKPAFLHAEELHFFREWLGSMGATIPPPPTREEPAPKEEENMETRSPEPEPTSEPTPEPKPDPPPEPAKEPEEEESEESAESDLEFDKEGCVEPDTDDPQPMGDPSVEITDEMRDKATELRSQAQAAMSEGKLEEATSLFTEAIMKNCKSAPLFYKRGCCYVKQKKPNAAVRDCTRAMEINQDSAQSYKWRGRAYELLGDWESSAKDLRIAARLDFDEQVNDWLHQVEPKAKRIAEHKRKYELKKEERELRKKKEKARKAREANEKAKEEERKRRQQQQSQFGGGMPGGFPGGMPGGFPGGMPGGFPGGFPGGMPGGFPGGMPGGMPGGFPGGMPGGMPGGFPGGEMPPGGMPEGAPNLTELLQDPELMQAFQDPEVMEAFQNVSQNPANIKNYEDNPKIKRIIEKLSKKFGKAGGAGGSGSQPPPQPPPASGFGGGTVPDMDID